MTPAQRLGVEQARLDGWDRLQSGQPADAMAFFQRALEIAPHDPEALVGMASSLRQQGQLRDAILSCDAAIRCAPHYAAAWLERAFVLTAGGSIDAAFECYTRTVELDSANAAALAGLASIAARRGDTDDARDAAMRALSLEPNNAIATFALAANEIDAGEAVAAAERIETLLETLPSASPERSVAYNLLGDARNRLGQIEAAFDAYILGKRDFADVHAVQFAARDQSHRAFIEMIAAGVEKLADTKSWALPECDREPPVARHVFLLGYPRSGTTLVENILASLPNTTALEERPTLRDADQAFLSDPRGLERLTSLDASTVQPYREAYWAKVAAARAMPPADGMFVDMDPLKGTRLPIIARLFPGARIIVMQRDPRDVVWSCFHTNFALTNASYEFTDLRNTALHYDAMMRLTELCLAQFHIEAHRLRYDALVTDFDVTTRHLCAFLGIDWSPSLRHFDRTAKERGVATASAAQVRKPLYNGTRQWERYRNFMEPVLPILEPWVARFGFDAS